MGRTASTVYQTHTGTKGHTTPASDFTRHATRSMCHRTSKRPRKGAGPALRPPCVDCRSHRQSFTVVAGKLHGELPLPVSERPKNPLHSNRVSRRQHSRRLGPGHSRGGGRLVCCSTLFSAHWRPVAPLSPAVTTKRVSRYCSMFPRGQNHSQLRAFKFCFLVTEKNTLQRLGLFILQVWYPVRSQCLRRQRYSSRRDTASSLVATHTREASGWPRAVCPQPGSRSVGHRMPWASVSAVTHAHIHTSSATRRKLCTRRTGKSSSPSAETALWASTILKGAGRGAWVSMVPPSGVLRKDARHVQGP